MLTRRVMLKAACGSLFLPRFVAADEPAVGAFDAALEYLRRQNGHALLVYFDGKVVCEEYLNGYKADQPHRLASGTKSFSAALAVAAIDDDLLKWNEPVADTIHEWQNEPVKRTITIRQLLTLSSGLAPGKVGIAPTYAEAIQARVLEKPNTQFRYGPTAFQIFGEVMRRKLAGKSETPLEYLQRKVLDPIGLEIANWRKDSDGNALLPGGAELTARQWAKYGLLLADGGIWEGKQLLSRDNLRSCLQPCATNRNYGTTFWLVGRGPQVRAAGVPADAYMAAGSGKQRLYVIPSRQVVAVQFAETERFNNAAFLGHLMAGVETISKSIPD